MLSREEILNEAKKHFFAAMLEGWVGGGELKDVPGMLGLKKTEYQAEDFRVLDQFGGSALSYGVTLIWYCDIPVWVMNYAGQYPKEYIPYLKRALVYAYKNRCFLGGRGLPAYLMRDAYDDPMILYTNDVSPKSDFTRFSGEERLALSSCVPGTLNHSLAFGEHVFERPIGYHTYSGIALI